MTLARVFVGVALAAQLIGADAARAGDRYTPVVMSVMSTPRWFEGTDSRHHLVYELALTNGVGVPITVQSVKVRDVARRRTVERLSGAALAGSMSPLASPGDAATTIPGSGMGVVWLDIRCRAGKRFRARFATP